MFSLKRYEKNPILEPLLPFEKEGVFNPGVVDTSDGVVMLYRAVGEWNNYISRLGLAKSSDGINFERIGPEPAFFGKESFDKWGTEDPRITKIEDDYYITYVALSRPVRENNVGTPNLQTETALLKTRDFKTFENLGIISPKDSDNKDIVLFPRKINGRYCMLHRPNHWHKTWCDHLRAEGQAMTWPCELPLATENPGVWIAWSTDFKNWTDHQVFLQSSHPEDSKVGPGLPPIETQDGWLIIYHHTVKTEEKDHFKYSIRAALFDLDEPTKLISKLPHHILEPEMPYEMEQASSIVFPTGGFVREDTLYIYYGASDRYIGLATGSISELLNELKNNK